jgi:NADH-quinone oxidoreductase subunit L
MGGLRHYLPVTWVVMWVATLAISGFPLFSGFFSKDEILGASFARGAQFPIYYLFYAMGLIAALITAYYMARLMAMTFHGETRTSETERSHLHDAPLTMTGPLVVLAFLSLVGGVINLPAFIGGGAGLEHWLEPVTAPAAEFFRLQVAEGATEWLLIGAAVVIGLLGLVWGYLATVRRQIVPAREAQPDVGLASLVFHKYYIDEIYDALVVRPLVWLSRVVLWRGVDQGLIDGVAVNGPARLSLGLGWVGSRLQSGQVGFYVILFMIGALWILRVVVG